jgi:transposase
MLGIDTSKDTLSAAFCDPVTRSLLWEKKVSNTSAGIASLLIKTPLSAPWVIEPTGRYSAFAAKIAQESGRQVLLAPPRKAKAFLKSIQSRAKTDRLDGRGLALFGLSRDLAPYPIKSQSVEQLDQLLSARKGLSLALTSLKQRQAELPFASEALGASVEALTAQIKALDGQIAAHIEASPEFAAAARLDEVPGIGRVTAAAVTARLAAKNFDHPDKFVAYIGLDIGVVESGKRKGQLGLTKQGDAEIRRLLYVCAQANLRTKDSPFKQQFERELKKGLSKTGALNAVARKLAKVCWSLHHHGTSYNADRVHTQPKRKTSEAVESTEPGGG